MQKVRKISGVVAQLAANRKALRLAGMSALATFAMYAGNGRAEGGVTLYGIADLGVRYATNANAAKNSKVELSEGPLTGSRFGLRGSEALGGGTSAFFVLEGGFDLGTGVSLQSSSAGYGQVSSGGAGRLFGRQAYVGVNGRYGSFSLGRQYGVGYQAMAGAQIFGNPNLDTLIIVSGYTGSRLDNMVKYEISLNGFRFGAHHVFGEVPGEPRANASTAVSVGYGGGPFDVAAMYQEANNADGTDRRKIAGIAGNFASHGVKLTVGYMNNRYKASETQNDIVMGGASYQFSPAWLMGVGAFHDRQRDPDGKRTGVYALVNYALSKRSDLYLEADYNQISGRYALIKSQGATGGKVGAMLGIRHKF